MVTYRENQQDSIWRAIADHRRRRIVDALAEQPLSTGDIVGLFSDIGRTAVLKHLNILKQVDLIRVRPEGRVRWNHLNAKPINDACNDWISRHVNAVKRSAEQLKIICEDPQDP